MPEKRHPWFIEPPVKLFQAALPCAILRVEWSGHLCGYVGVPEGHAAYDRHYDDISVSVHGGLTFARQGLGLHDNTIHLPDYWWFGFDCAHSGDLTPIDAMQREKPWIDFVKDNVYRDINYVYAECVSLANQLVEQH